MLFGTAPCPGWDRFEPHLLPRGTEGSNPARSTKESVSPGAFHGYRRKGPAFAGAVSLDETRERDLLATSRLALTDFL
jgi:hypothetical protein